MTKLKLMTMAKNKVERLPTSPPRRSGSWGKNNTIDIRVDGGYNKMNHITTEWKGQYMNIEIAKNAYIISTDFPFTYHRAYDRGDGSDTRLIEAMDRFAREVEVYK